MAEGLRFRPERDRRSAWRTLGPMSLLFVLAALGLVLRATCRPDDAGVLVEVRGDVPRPGFHQLEEPTLAAAVAAAGGDPEGLPATPLHGGDQVVVGPGGAHVSPTSDPLLVGLPVDPNTADAGALASLPGVGPVAAESIVAERPYACMDDLTRVRGLGPSTVADLAPWLRLPATCPPADPVDLNTASAADLEALPGIGPVTAARIVVDRDERGPYRTLDELIRVDGIGPATVEGLRARARTSPPAPR